MASCSGSNSTCSSTWRGGTVRRTLPLSGRLLQHLDDPRADQIVGIQIGTDHADGKRRGLAGEGLADALGQHRIDLHQLIRKIIEHVADRGVDLAGAAALARIDLHLELALVRRIRILAVLGAADLLGDALDPGNGDEPLGDLLADAGGLRQRYPGAQRCVRNQIVLAEIGQQSRAQQRQEDHPGNAADEHDGDQRARPPVEPCDRGVLAALQAAQKRRFGFRRVPRHHQRAQRRRRAHGDQQRQAHGEQEGNRQGPEERALESGHRQYGQERHGHRGRRIEHRPANLQRGADEQVADVHIPGGAAAAAKDVLDVDDGIVDHHAERDDQAAERHRIKAQPQRFENPDRRQQCERDRAEGNQCAAPVAQGDQQERDDQHGANGQRVSQLLDRAFDETGRPEQRRMVLHSLLGQRRRQRIEPLLESPGDLERVGAELGRGLDEHARACRRSVHRRNAARRLLAMWRRRRGAPASRRACRPPPAPGRRAWRRGPGPG